MSKDTKGPDNPPAFPNSVQPDFQWAESGMTLRDWFAGQALAGLMAHSAAYERMDRRPQFAAEKAYAMADAMLAARDAS